MTTPAGWYPEPDGRQQRYWDGERWTEYVAPLPPAGAEPTTPVPSPSAGPPPSDEGAPDATAVHHGGGRGRIVGGVAAAALVVLAGFFAYTQLAGADGGSDSPEEAVEALLDAVSNEDLVGVAESVLPGERRTYVDPVLEGLGHLQRWGVLDESLDTSDVAGFEFEIDGLELRAEPAADDIVNVYASGTMTAALNGTDLPVGDLLGERIDGDLSQYDEPAETSEFDDVMFTTVREDGRWYVSAMYTIGETARLQSGEPVPAGIAPIGSDSPEAAVDGMVGAITAFDLEEVIARLNPDEAQALQRYAPLFLDEAQAGLDDAVAEAGLALDIDVETEITERDGLAIVNFTTFAASVEADGDTMSVTFDGECLTVTADGETEEVCPEEGDGQALDLTDTPAGDLTAVFDDIEPTGLVVAQRDGEWFVSPVGTYTDTILAVMRAIDRDELERVIDALEDGSLETWLEAEMEDYVGGAFGDMVDELEGSSGDGWSDYEDTYDIEGLVAACESGEMVACDDLYWASDLGSDEERLALTCGGTIDEQDASPGNCATGGATGADAGSYGDDPDLDALWDACDAGDMVACDDLFWSSAIGSEYESFAQSCGGKLEVGEAFGECADLVGASSG